MSLWVGICLTLNAGAALGEKVGPAPSRGFRALFVGQPSSVRRLEQGPFTSCEWISRGEVVALEWSGPTPVPLSFILGGYEEAFLAAQDQTARTRGQRFSRLEDEHWVVERFGRMRALGGRAYLRHSLPRRFSWQFLNEQCETLR